MRPHRWQPTRLPRPWDPPGKNTGVGCHFLLQCMKVKSEREVAQSCPTLSDPMDCSPSGSSAHVIFQARVLEWVAIAFSEPLTLNVINSKMQIPIPQQTHTHTHTHHLVTQLCCTLCNPMDCSPPGSSVHRISQERTLEWVAISISRESSQPRDGT